MPSFLTTGNEEQFFAASRVLSIAVVEEGDVLFFPPQWLHAVVTSKGPNFMLNLRNVALLKSFFVNPFRFMEWGLATTMEYLLVMTSCGASILNI